MNDSRPSESHSRLGSWVIQCAELRMLADEGSVESISKSQA